MKRGKGSGDGAAQASDTNRPGSERSQAIAERIKNAPERKPKRFGTPRPFAAKPKPEGYIFGRPTLYRPEYCEAVINVMGRGFDLTAFAGSINVSRDAVYRWIAAHPDFRDAVKIAQAKRLYILQEKLLTTKVGVGVTAAIFALKNAAPDDWQDRYNVSSETTVRIEHVSDAQLLEVIGNSIKTIEHSPNTATD